MYKQNEFKNERIRDFGKQDADLSPRKCWPMAYCYKDYRPCYSLSVEKRAGARKRDSYGTTPCCCAGAREPEGERGCESEKTENQFYFTNPLVFIHSDRQRALLANCYDDAPWSLNVLFARIVYNEVSSNAAGNKLPPGRSPSSSQKGSPPYARSRGANPKFKYFIPEGGGFSNF